MTIILDGQQSKDLYVRGRYMEKIHERNGAESRSKSKFRNKFTTIVTRRDM